MLYLDFEGRNGFVVSMGLAWVMELVKLPCVFIFTEKLVHITGVFSTFGDWSSMNDGCGQYIHVGNNTSIRIGGARKNKGEFVNIDSTCDTENALKSLW